MPRVSKIAISLPEQMLEDIEKERAIRHESRSQFFLRAAEALLRSRREEELDEQYARGYMQQPETEQEIEAADRAAIAILASEPWE